jgi:hypothetical protein
MLGNLSSKRWMCVFTVALALCFASVVAGCKKNTPAPAKSEEGASKEAPKADKKAKEQPDKAADEKVEEPIEAPEPDEAVVPDKTAKEEKVEENTPPADKMAPNADGKTPSADAVSAPAIDREKLSEVFVAMWCAEQKGATPEELLVIYHKYDYPPLGNWYDVWNNAVVDSRWARKVMAEARSACPMKKPAAKAEPEDPEKPLPVPAPPVEKKAE